MIDETLFEAEEKMESAVEHAKEEFAAIRTGRATPAMFSKIMVDYYGAPTPVTQMASVGVPEPRMVIVKPYDASQLGPIERAIRDSDLGVNPNNEGTQLRIHLPQMTEERRRDMIKVARTKAEEGRVAIRNIRRRAKEQIDKMFKGIVDQFDRESTALYGTAHLWDDGIIDPRDTRRILAFTLSIARESIVRPLNPITFGVARM